MTCERSRVRFAFSCTIALSTDSFRGRTTTNGQFVYALSRAACIVRYTASARTLARKPAPIGGIASAQSASAPFSAVSCTECVRTSPTPGCENVKSLRVRGEPGPVWLCPLDTAQTASLTLSEPFMAVLVLLGLHSGNIRPSGRRR
jgi:hypothetical protein